MNTRLWHLSTVGDYMRKKPEPKPAEGGGDQVLLEDRLERLALICMAMWSLVQSETNLTEDDLFERVKEIDLMDGVTDGKITRQVAQCGSCRRRWPRTAPRRIRDRRRPQ